MATNKIKFIGDGDEENENEVHFTSPLGGDYTLCGLTLDGDFKTCGSFEPTNEKVNCTNCMKIIRFSIRESKK